MKRLSIKPIDAATALCWKQEAVNCLKKMEDMPEPMEADLMNMLRPNYKPAGHILLEPEGYLKDLAYLKKGLAKLYLLDALTGKQQILHIWVPGELIVLYKLFRKRLLNAQYYIAVICDAELVSISNDHMDLMYRDYPAADRMTVNILEAKGERRIKQLEILSIEVKADRYKRFTALFPELIHCLGNEDLCAFLAISIPTLIRARAEYLNGKSE